MSLVRLAEPVSTEMSAVDMMALSTPMSTRPLSPCGKSSTTSAAMTLFDDARSGRMSFPAIPRKVLAPAMMSTSTAA